MPQVVPFYLGLLVPPPSRALLTGRPFSLSNFYFLVSGVAGQTGSFPYSESLQSLRAKRSISQEHQKTSRPSPSSIAGLARVALVVADFKGIRDG